VVSDKLNLSNYSKVSVSNSSYQEKSLSDHFVHPTSIVDADVTIGDGTKVWHFSHISRGANLGERCVIGQNCFIGGNVIIGDHCKLQNNVSIYSRVTLEEGVFCGPSCVFTNDLTPRALFPKGGAEFWVPTLVKRGATIGANATIVCGNTLGEHCMIGAGAVITRDVPAFALMLGVPAVQAGWACACGVRLPLPVTASDEQTARCSVCGRGYQLKNGSVSPAEPI